MRAIYIVGYILVSLVIVVILLPKDKLYYQLEKSLHHSDIIISDEKIEPNILSIDIKDATIYYKNKKIATLNSANISTTLLKTDIEINNAQIKYMMDKKIETIDISYSLLSRTSINIVANAKEFEAKVSIDISANRAYINLYPKGNNSIRYITNGMKKSSDGGYEYEYIF
jgi:hypothetical protein